MQTRHLVDPDLLIVADSFPALRLGETPLAEVRAAMAAAVPAVQTGDVDGVIAESRMIAGRDGDPPVAILMYRPVDTDGAMPAILHIHGGGFVLGSSAGMDIANRGLARVLGCMVVSVDYRLAPEGPFPAAIRDCHAAFLWLHAQAPALSVDPTRIGVKGESAGGGLAAALALMVRDLGGPTLAFQHLIFPMLDDRTCTIERPPPYAGEFIWTASDNAFGWRALLGEAPGGDNVSPYAAPARAASLAGLPPTFLSVGALDLFLDEDVDYARRLARAGVPVELHVYPGAFHAFHLAPEAAVTRLAERDSLTALRRACGR